MHIQLSEHFSYGKLLRFTFPSMVMMVFTSIYGVVDGVFVSNFVGADSFAAVNLIMPFLMLLGALGFMLGTGGSALVSFTLGSGETERARRIFSLLIYVLLVSGAVLTVAGIAVMEPIARLLGADETLLPLCVLYGRLVLLALIPFMLQNAFQSFFVTAERPHLGLYVTIAAGLTNMALDALFIAGPGHRSEPVCGRHSAPGVLRAAQPQQAPPVPRQMGRPRPGQGLRQRVLGVYDQHLHVSGEYAL